LLDDILLARPLLDVSRDALHVIAAESGLKTVADPSNADRRFDRARIRALMPMLAEQGLDAPRLAETATRLGRAAGALDHYADAFLQAHFSADPFGVVSGSVEAFAELPEEVALRALARILKVVGGADYTPPLAGIESIRHAVIAGGAGNLKRTLSGVVVSLAGKTLTAEREWGRTGLVEAAAPAGATLLWDGRFRVEVPRLPGALQVGALGCSDRRLRSPAAASGRLKTLPGLYRDGTLVAVPSVVAPAQTGGPLDILAVECIVGQRLGLGR
jgi:tRNA(Ile)-lysidine synthase